MPGISFAYRADGGAVGAPFEMEQIVGYSLTGSTAIWGGDVLVSSTYSGVSLNSVPSVRRMLPADKTALYGGVSVNAAPAAPTLTLVTAATYGSFFLANGAYYVVITYVSATGETVASAQATVTTAGGTQTILVSPPAAATGAIGYRVYMSAIGGTGGPYYLQSGIVSIGQQFIIQGTITTGAAIVTGANPPTVNTSGKIAGILGVALFGATTSAASQITGGPALGYGNINYQFQSIGQGVPTDPKTGCSLIQYAAAVPQNVFKGFLDSTAANATVTLNNTLAGLIQTVVGGVTTYTIDTVLAAGAPCLRILRPEMTDVNYGANGGAVYFQFLENYSQPLLGVNYTAQ